MTEHWCDGCPIKEECNQTNNDIMMCKAYNLELRNPQSRPSKEELKSGYN